MDEAALFAVLFESLKLFSVMGNAVELLKVILTSVGFVEHFYLFFLRRRSLIVEVLSRSPTEEWASPCLVGVLSPSPTMEWALPTFRLWTSTLPITRPSKDLEQANLGERRKDHGTCQNFSLQTRDCGTIFGI